MAARRGDPGMNRRSPRLLQVMAGAPHGGAETFFVRLATALQRAGQDQRILIRRNADRAASLRAAGVETTELPFGNRFDLITRLGFRRVIRSYAPDIVLTWMNRATDFCPRGPFVHAARLGGYYDLKYYRNCDELIGNTQAIVDYIKEQGWPPGRVHYLPNFVPAMTGPPIARSSLDTPEDAIVALALGRLHPNKGFDVLLEALGKTRGVYLWLAGEGPLGVALEGRATKLGLTGRVRLLGWRDDTGPLLAAADMLVCPSRSEPLGNVVIEAWSAGKPVLATASAGPAALIRDGETGLLAPVENAAVLADAMMRLADDTTLRQRLGAAGHAAYLAEFHEDAVVAHYLSFFQRVCR